MNIIVCVKQVPDTETKIKPNADCSYIDTNSIKWVMNPYDEFAVEQALIMKSKNADATVTVIRVGSVKDTEALRTAMAMGADDAIHVDAPDYLDSYATSKAIKQALLKSGKEPSLILMGKQAIDDDCLQVPQILAQMMNFPCVNVVVEFENNDNTYVLKREIEGGAREIYEVSTPVIVSCNKGLNTPRYASLPGIMKAKRKPLTQYSLADLNISENDQKIKYSEFHLPAEKPAGKKFEAMEEDQISSVVQEVVNLLRTQSKVI